MLTIAHAGSAPRSRRLVISRQDVVPENLTARQRAKIRRILTKHTEQIQHLARQLATGARCVDPESALATVHTLGRTCVNILRSSRAAAET